MKLGVSMANVKLTKVIEKLNLKNLTPDIPVDKIQITQPDINRPALQIAGYFEYFDASRIQIIGYVEHSYMQNALGPGQKREAYEKLLDYPI